jgi:hypothetical protein
VGVELRKMLSGERGNPISAEFEFPTWPDNGYVIFFELLINS